MKRPVRRRKKKREELYNPRQVNELHDLFLNELESIYAVEQALVKALPKFMNAASSKRLKEVFKEHLAETKEQVNRLALVFKELRHHPMPASIDGLQGLLQESAHVLQAHWAPDLKDAALIHCAQRIEHFEIAAYGTLKAFAKHLRQEEIYRLLEMNSKEEGHANKRLTDIAEGTLFTEGLNYKARLCA